MSKVKILSVEQTEKAGLFTICFENENFSEFEKFIQKFKDNAECKRDFQKDQVCALPIEYGKLRLYCLRMSDCVLIVGNGGKKTTRTYNESEELSGYVISLQKLDELIKVAVKKGDITIEEKTITGIETKEFDL